VHDEPEAPRGQGDLPLALRLSVGLGRTVGPSKESKNLLSRGQIAGNSLFMKDLMFGAQPLLVFAR
jgi:hypothetical protein